MKLSIWNRDTSMTPLVRVKEDLKIYVAETEESTERMLETIYAIMENNGLTYQQAINTEEGREALYQLMLHRHWVAFHAEVIRTVVASEEDVFKAGYKKLSLNQTATIETNILLDQFIRETSAYFEEQMSDPRW